MIRIGHGYDVHKFGSESPLIICGEHIEHDTGLIAHSDGDVALHALCDALLGALALGDIGKHFPDTSDSYVDASSIELLKEVYKLVTKEGYSLVNADITIAAQAPKMSPHITAMRSNIASALNIGINQISVKATTTEKLGFVGREEGIACDAVVLVTHES
ncbi:2-C-methyl-D-erythritol 2,4-cyclodiphosphate synthase [Ningiella sp. W23]|uniref:2-C-methyl-D-erythritol 2,4-cyclodiphosphate synthase n=1 Tax=Ningiella sp. W23 TaxID=3023715 RepID=UPI0037566F9F